MMKKSFMLVLLATLTVSCNAQLAEQPISADALRKAVTGHSPEEVAAILVQTLGQSRAYADFSLGSQRKKRDLKYLAMGVMAGFLAGVIVYKGYQHWSGQAQELENTKLELDTAKAKADELAKAGDEQMDEALGELLHLREKYDRLKAQLAEYDEAEEEEDAAPAIRPVAAPSADPAGKKWYHWRPWWQ